MRAHERVGRAVWIAYLILGAPVVFFLLANWIVTLPFWFQESTGPVEDTLHLLVDQFAVASVSVAFPLVWIFFVLTAHRFEERRKRMIPFLANLIPVVGLLRFSQMLFQDEGSDFVWMVFYACTLAALLVVGLLAAGLSFLHGFGNGEVNP